MAFYTRTIEIDGVIYKQISTSQWQNVKTGQVIDGTKMVYIINEFKTKKGRGSVQPITPGGGASGSCCEIPNMINGAFICTEKDEGSCPGGCFKSGQNCNVTDESPEACLGCIRCCYIGNQYCIARRPEQCVPVGNGGGTYFGSNGCTACKYGVCSSDQNNNTTNATERFYGSRGCTGTFIVGGGVSDFRTGVFCTGSGVGQTCFGPGMQYQALTPHFIQGGTCADCILGACCTGGSCAGITSQSACSTLNGLFFAGQTCGLCDFGVYCQGSTTNRTCIRTGYRGENLSNQFQVGATCNYCITGTCCINGTVSFGDNVRQSTCSGNFFPNRFAPDACDKGSCCVGESCTENVFRYDCAQIFNNGMTCIACSNGACCLPSGGCTLATYANCFAQGGTFYGGATCSACDVGSCCSGITCTDQRRGDGCEGGFYAGIDCSISPCERGACCTGGNCTENTRTIDCFNINGTHFPGATCFACATGSICDFNDENVFTCFPNEYFGEWNNFGSFFRNQGCSACDQGACCNLLGGGVTGIRGDCTGSSTFYAGQTLFVCDAGVYCTGSGVGQTCFGLGHRGQSLTNNFIAGATCSSCILGACCTGGTCLGGGLTSQAACSSAGGLFFAGRTCTVCDFGVYCTGATCLSLGYRGQSLSNNFILGATCSSCIQGACCTGGTCLGGGQTSQAACSSVSGLFYAGATCRSCDFGVYCTGATCFGLGYRAQALTNNFIQGATCNSCILGACCTGGTCLGGGQTSQAACSVAGGTFYVGATCTQCVTGVFCTGSGVGQTCFGLGHRGQSLTNNFIAGATCSSCILGACCTGGSCLGGGLTSQAACSAVGGLFYAGTTCVSCDYGVYCTGSNETTSCLGLGYRAQNLSNQFVISGSCVDCLYGSCCQGTTCLGITNEANCPKPNAFFAGMTCAACDTGTGACCTGGSSSITTITGCNALGGIFFPEGTTALCITGSCCTGGTCITEIAGRSGNCQLFIAGATCGICDTGVYCTGATCLQLGFRGQSLTSNFIAGATCNSCILGICCTGGTCISGGQTAQINCPSSVGSFVVGATQCSACAINVNCCVGGTHSYILAEQCVALGGIVFEGAEDSLVCQSGAFCTGNTCAGVTLRGFNLSDTFLVESDCDDCITGVCCETDYTPQIRTRRECSLIPYATFYPGSNDLNICVEGLTFGICCREEICTENVEQGECDGYFVSNAIASQNSISCASNACEIGVCCDENEIQSVTGGVCLGVMTRAECTILNGDFFSASSGASCDNCIYTPMLASVLLTHIPQADEEPSKAGIYTGSVTGFTGNEIFPRREVSAADSSWLVRRNAAADSNFWGSNAITGPVNMVRSVSQQGLYFSHRYMSFDYRGFTAWWNNKPIISVFGSYYGSWQGNTGIHDYSPVFTSGLTRENSGYTFGYINGFTFETPRYYRVVLGYDNPENLFYDQSFSYRFSHSDSGAGGFRYYSRNDATKHAGLNPNNYNVYGALQYYKGSNNPIDFATPVLLQVFAENPLRRRIRPVGSCCVGATCIGIVTSDHCTARGGTFNQGKRCARCSPSLVFGNCCAGGTHAGYTSLAACNAISGVLFEGPSFNAEVCKVGIICNENRTCYQGISYSYYGDFTTANNKFFIEGDYRASIGCNACNVGLCCTGGTCFGVVSESQCDSLGGEITYDITCGEEVNNCELGVCCPFDPGCGTVTTRGRCTEGFIFIAGATLGATCSACSQLFRISQETPGVTYDIVFSKGTTHGKFFDGSVWVQETEGLKIRGMRTRYVGMTLGARGHTMYANSILERQITPQGLIGNVYVHGCAKNIPPFFYVDSVRGVIRVDTEPFTSISFGDFNAGWEHGKFPGATEIATQYNQFDLNGFMRMRSQLYGDGVTLSGNDTFMMNTTNFDPTKVETAWLDNAKGYPYQLFSRRANTTTYGIINCVTATAAAYINSIGSTFCFRPPTTWPDEDRANRPIYNIKQIEGKIPGQTGITLTVLNINVAADKNFIIRAGYPNSDLYAQSYSQVSEFGSGINYGTTTPIWSMFGARSNNSSYGEQYMNGLQDLLTIVHATGAGVTSGGIRYTPALTVDQRRNIIGRIVQYGIDSWGAQRAFCVLAAGAGQKSGRTRPWVSIAGYFLGETAMYEPEATMLLDTARMQRWKQYLYTNKVVCSPKEDCVTEAQWRSFRVGGTGPENNQRGIRRQLAQWNENAALTTYEYVNDPSNPILHHSYVGDAYRLRIENCSPTGLTGITFYNSIGVTRPCTDLISVYGDFGVIRWGTGSGPATSNPDIRNPYKSLGYYNYDQKGGIKQVFTNTWLKVLSGPGSSGGQGSRYYRIIDANSGGFLWSKGADTDSKPCPASLGGGYQLVIGQTWADGIPDHTSVIQIYPFIEEDFGITRPCIHCDSGFTSGTIPGFISVGNPDGGCASRWEGMADCSLWDANAGVAMYYSTAVPGWLTPFYFLKHIQKTRGITLISDAFPVTDYVDMRFYTSPFNLYTWSQLEPNLSYNSSLRAWFPPVSTSTEIVKHINFAQHFPGIRRYIYGQQTPITIW